MALRVDLIYNTFKNKNQRKLNQSKLPPIFADQQKAMKSPNIV